MPFEDELSEELRRTGETFDLSGRAALVDGALEQGRRSLRRRRSAAVAGSVLALALVGGGGAFGAGLLGSGGGGGTGVASSRPADPVNLTGGLSEEKVAAVLEKLLPPGTAKEARGAVTGGADGPKRVSASAVYDDGKGKGSVQVFLYPAPGSKAAEGTDCEEPPGTTPGIVSGEEGYDSGLTVCFDSGADGRGTGTEADSGTEADGASGPGGSSGAARAVFFTAGGVAVDARAYNRVTGSGAGATRSGPALGDKALMELARAVEWRPLAAALTGDADAVETDGPSRASGKPSPDAEDVERTDKDTEKGAEEGAEKDTPPTGKPSSDTSRPGAEDSPALPLDYTLLMPTFLKLLPEGLTVGEKTDSGGEFASVVVDDGRGKTLVQINVQPDMRDVAHQLYGDATTLPDGTLLATSQQPGEKGGAGVVWWTADTMRPDGMRVVVSAFNSGAQSTPATRPEPALTLEQLTAVATSPEWLKLQQK
ncbi:hypothetical protein [Streptomyces sp. NPDC059452]|uniref:hypothetical protein n=1 Tax=Streptomyces sp. NPDC059452 TaxID=3346835 RepID=UPI003699BCB8